MDTKTKSRVKTIISILIVIGIVLGGIRLAGFLQGNFFILPLAYGASPPVVLPSPDYLTEKEFAIYGNLDCNNPNAIAGFIWNYSDFYTPKEQCELYIQAAKIMHTKIGIELEANITITNITVKP